LLILSEMCKSQLNHVDIMCFMKETLVSLQKDCYEVYALVPGLLREEVSKKKSFSYRGCTVVMH
jgi:hypothetical protein